MHAKFKTHLIGVAVGLGFVLTGFGLGEPPRTAYGRGTPVALSGQAELAAPAAEARRGALQRHLGMPYVSFAALLPRKES